MDLLALNQPQATGTRMTLSHSSHTVRLTSSRVHDIFAELRTSPEPAPLQQNPVPGPIPIGQRRATLNASSWELSNALRAISQETDVNITLAHKEDPKVTVQLKDMPLEEILRVLAALTDLKFLQIDESYIMATVEVLEASFPREFAQQYPTLAKGLPEEVVVKSYTVSHVSARQAVETLKGLLKEGEAIGVAVGPAPDVPNITVSSGSSIRNEGASGGTTAGVETGQNTEGNGRTIMLRGPKKQVQEAIKLLREIDSPRPQVNIKVSIMDVSNDAMRELGISWSFGNITLTERAPSGISFETLDRSPQTFQGIIRALESNGRTKILAEPNLGVLDGQSAYILIGDRINYPVVIGLSDNNTPIYDIKEEKVGVYFQVGANISEDGEIIMNLYPQVSSITGFLSVNGASYPQVSTREARTVMRVSNGETIAVAGLIRTEEIESWEKVPILGDIPLLGELFKKKKTTKENSQVMIFITPTIMGDES